jgi:hypothetical protein
MTEIFDDEYVNSRRLPFFNVVRIIADYLKVQPFMSDFNGSIYTYRRDDVPNISLPAMFIYPTTIKSSAAGYRSETIIRIEVVRNKNTANRGAIYQFNQNIIERLILTLCYSNEFFLRNINRELTYITLFGEKYVSQYDDDSGVCVLDILCTCWIPEYIRWVSKFNFNATGDQSRYTFTTSPQQTETVTKPDNYYDKFRGDNK